MRPLVKRWRSQGFRIFSFLDDGIFGFHSRSHHAIATVATDLNSAGVTLNKEKCTLFPTRQGNWLGLLVDTKSYTLAVSTEKIENLFLVRSAITRHTSSARQIARIAGTIISMGLATGSLTWPFTSSFYHFMDLAGHSDTKICLNRDIAQELQFRDENLSALNRYAIKHGTPLLKIEYSNASKHSNGGYILTKSGHAIVHSRFNTQQMNKVSTYHQLLAAKHFLEDFANTLQHEKLLWYFNNLSVVRILRSGSSITLAY